MAITHTKVSALGDGADTTLVRPVDWNAAHTGQPTSISDFLDDTTGGTDALVTKAPTSNALYDGLLTKIPNSVLTERGSVIFRNATIPAELLHGTTGEVLTTKGHDADPLWLNNDIYVFPILLAATQIGTTYTTVPANDMSGVSEPGCFGLSDTFSCRWRFLGTIKRTLADNTITDTLTMKFLFNAAAVSGAEVVASILGTYYNGSTRGFATAWTATLANAAANDNQVRIQAKVATNNNVYSLLTLCIQIQLI